MSIQNAPQSNKNRPAARFDSGCAVRRCPTLAIDPGTSESAFVLWDGKQVLRCGIVPNEELRKMLYSLVTSYQGTRSVAIEMIASYGMPVGKETFETVLWIGRFYETVNSCCSTPIQLVYRKDVKMHLCQSMRAKDGNVSQALRDKHGEVGTKKAPGPLYGVKSHIWSALAVADYAWENPAQ